MSKTHKCFAIGCPRRAKPAAIGCRTHWFTLPLTTRERIWRLYNQGRVRTIDYCSTLLEAVREVAKREGRPVRGDEKELLVWRRIIDQLERAAEAGRRSAGNG